MAKQHVTTSVNGEEREFLCLPEQTMLEALREELNLTGTKEGCATGDCGACSILVDGTLVCSCLMLAAEAEGREVTTIEGLADDEQLHPIQEGFWEHHGLQCGFCTPGMILASHQLLIRNPDPTEEEIRHGIEGNLCRCTGYQHIVDAVRYAAQKLRK